MELKSTPLKEEHIRLGAKMVDFAGWIMPVEYSGLRREHEVVRTKVGLFDVSHMGEIRVKGPKALEAAQWLTTNDVAKLENGQAQYSLLPNDQGGVVDDLIVYCIQKNQDYLFCVNASNIEKDFAWMLKNNKGAEIVNESAKWGQIAVQGPKAMQLAAKVCGEAVMQIPVFEYRQIAFGGDFLLVARTGYTGEDGVEIFVPALRTVDLWKRLLEEGQSLGVEPIGLGARDTLRTEMRYPLYGHELSDTTNPYSAGLGWVIKPEKKSFVGQDLIVGGKEKLTQKMVGFRMSDRGIARHGYKLFSEDGKEIGITTSGTLSPTLNDNIGIGFVDKKFADVGTALNVEIRGRKVRAEVVPTPFVNKKKN